MTGHYANEWDADAKQDREQAEYDEGLAEEPETEDLDSLRVTVLQKTESMNALVGVIYAGPRRSWQSVRQALEADGYTLTVSPLADFPGLPETAYSTCHYPYIVRVSHPIRKGWLLGLDRD